MSASKARVLGGLSSLFRSASKPCVSATTTTAASAAAASPSPSSAVENSTLKRFVAVLDTPPPKKSTSPQLAAVDSTLSSLNLDDLEDYSDSEEEGNNLSRHITSILTGDDSVSSIDSEISLEKVLDIPWFPGISYNNISARRKEVTRERKQKWFFKSSQVNYFNRLVQMCADRIGTDAAFAIFGKLGRETGLKEYNALIKVCIEKARSSSDEEVTLEQIHRAFRLFEAMKEQGFQIEEGTYGPFFSFLVDMGLVQEFHFFCGVIQDGNPYSLSRLGYYEMLLYIKVDDKEKIQELCNHIVTGGEENPPSLKENYLLALCEGDLQKEFLQLLENIDITKFSSVDCVASIFKSLGKLRMEALAEKFLIALKACDHGAENITNFLCSYIIGIPNLVVEDAITTFKNLHAKLEVTPSSASYEKLIRYCSDLLKVHMALNLVDEMLEAGLTVSIEALHYILHACEESCNFNLVDRVYAVIRHHKLKPNSETFRVMISLRVRMKDFAGAYSMLSDLEKLKLTPTASMYNAIMGGYFREKKIDKGLYVFKQMEEANVKPDSKTFSYLITNCESEEDMIEYYEEMKRSGVPVTKNVYMALINAYASCGQFQKAKQVLTDEGIPAKSVSEIKSVLIQALASRGQFSDALNMYKEIKQAGYNLEPKAAISLIEHYQSDEGANTMLELLEEIDDPEYWFDGCCRVILYCVRHKHLSPAVDLLKQLNDKCHTYELALEPFLDEVFSLIGDLEPSHLQTGIDLLRIVKNEFGITPPRKSLDFLLHACVNAKSLQNAQIVWKEYQAAGLPHNILNFLRMYQALLTAGDHKAAKILLTKIPKDDPHVRCVIHACQATYIDSTSKNMKKKKLKK
ncbi:hypothetical protein UlMin_043980 [Ulmus minor]